MYAISRSLVLEPVLLLPIFLSPSSAATVCDAPLYGKPICPAAHESLSVTVPREFPASTASIKNNVFSHRSLRSKTVRLAKQGLSCEDDFHKSAVFSSTFYYNSLI